MVCGVLNLACPMAEIGDKLLPPFLLWCLTVPIAIVAVALAWRRIWVVCILGAFGGWATIYCVRSFVFQDPLYADTLGEVGVGHILNEVLSVAFPWTAIVASPLLWRICHRGRVESVVVLCTSCGYDLRGTPNRCPECGLCVARSSNEMLNTPDGKMT